MSVLDVVLVVAFLVWLASCMPGLPRWASWVNLVALGMTLGCLTLDALGVASARMR